MTSILEYQHRLINNGRTSPKQLIRDQNWTVKSSYAKTMNMTRSLKSRPRSAATSRGAATRHKIVEAASQLVEKHGVTGTTLDDIMAASGTSKSQIYHYFRDRDALMDAVVEAQSKAVLSFQESCLSQVRTVDDLRAWRNKIVEINHLKRGAGGCPIGSLASELADRSESARCALAQSFAQWEAHIAAALETIKREGNLSQAADISKLAIGIVAALQGGLLMAQTDRTIRPLEVALDMALEHVSRQLTAPGDYLQ
ncbi:MAG: TetR/AcrR family transcriptional regulator [Rhodospirillales bacterium]|nr:TetR/AcrR family transcriptional regulator [Rhodospirillales bacterium]